MNLKNSTMDFPSFENNGSLILEEECLVTIKQFTGNGLIAIKSGKTIIQSEEFLFAGTIECDGQCDIYTDTDVSAPTIIQKGNGQLIFHQMFELPLEKIAAIQEKMQHIEDQYYQPQRELLNSKVHIAFPVINSALPIKEAETQKEAENSILPMITIGSFIISYYYFMEALGFEHSFNHVPGKNDLFWKYVMCSVPNKEYYKMYSLGVATVSLIVGLIASKSAIYDILKPTRN